MDVQIKSKCRNLVKILIFRNTSIEQLTNDEPERRFDAVVVTNYLHRPLFPQLLDSLAPGGLLLYETFAAGNERFGRPSNPDFLLQPGELLERVRGRLRVIAYEDVEEGPPRPAMMQRIVARREDGDL